MKKAKPLTFLVQQLRSLYFVLFGRQFDVYVSVTISLVHVSIPPNS